MPAHALDALPWQEDLFREAKHLYASGFNVLPLRPDSKRPFGVWTPLQWGRIAESDIEGIFGNPDHPVNLAIVCGATSGNLLVIDCDRQESFERLKGELKRRNLRTWVRNSPRGGHFYFLLEEGEANNFKGDGYEVRGHSCYVLAAPSIHPNTGEVLTIDKPTPLPATVKLEQLSFIKGVSLRRYSQRKEKHGVLPPVADTVLIGCDISGYPSNSEAEYAACLALLGTGHTPAEVLAIFRKCQPPHFKKVGEANFTKYVLEAAFKKREENRDGIESTAYGRLLYQALIDGINANPFPGRTGLSDTMVLCALLNRASMEGQATNFRASIRELAEIAGVATQTTQSALQRLKANGWVSLVSSKYAEANCYCLDLEKFTFHIQSRPTPLPSPLTTSAAEESPDAFHRNAFGSLGKLILSLLERAPGQRVADIARTLDRPPQSVRDVLDRMARYGVVSQDRFQWSLSVDFDILKLHEAAFDRNTTGSVERRKHRHNRERERHNANMILGQMERYFGRHKPRKNTDS